MAGYFVFEIAFEDLIGLEGGLVDDPHDPGGLTKWGISQRAYPNLDIRNLSIYDAKQIYWRDYWKALNLDRLPAVAAREVFEVAVNAGKKTAVLCLQRALNFLGSGVEEDGKIGPETLTAASYWARRNPNALVKAQNGEQYLFYKHVVSNRKRRGSAEPYRFAAGWLRRVEFPKENA